MTAHHPTLMSSEMTSDIDTGGYFERGSADPTSPAEQEASVEVDGFAPHLGPSSDRYFGSGYRKVEHGLHTLRFDTECGDEVTLTGTGSAQYPARWSAGADGTPRQPHLSTIDAVVLSIRVAEVYLRHVDHLSNGDIAFAWLSAIDIKAGPAPFSELDSIPVRCARTARDVLADGVVSHFKARIGSMSVSLSVRHALPPRFHTRIDTFGSGLPEISPPATGALTAHYRNTTHRSWLSFDSDRRDILHSRHQIHPSAAKCDGLAGAYWPNATVIDCLVLASQMAQVLIFSAPGASRKTTSNLWMRRARFSSDQPPAGLSATSMLRVVKSRAFNRGSAGTLMSVDVECPDMFGIAALASLAYEVSEPGGAEHSVPIGTSAPSNE